MSCNSEFSPIYSIVCLISLTVSVTMILFFLILQWQCCDVHVKEFDEFMSIRPCTKGWHNADPVS